MIEEFRERRSTARGLLYPRPMAFHPDIHHRRSIRLPNYDYTCPGAYFVTVCVQNRECLFGDVVGGSVQLNEWGRMVHDEWLRTETLRSNVRLYAFVVMPNHFHAIVTIDEFRRGTARRAPTTERFGRPVSGSLPTIMRAFKSAATKRINRLRTSPGVPVWQRNYYERIIRDDGEIHRIREYIAANPTHWAEDENHPDNIK